MKKLLVFTNIITISVLCATWYTSCSPGQLCSNTCFSFNAAPFTGVKGTLAQALVENYRTHQWKSYRNDGPRQLPDTRAVWFSVERLKLFLYEIEKSACQNGCNNNTLVLGVRCYFGTYPDDTLWANPAYELVQDGVNPEYEGHHTLLLVPTYHDGVNDVDFDPLHWDAGQCRPQPLDSVFVAGSTVGFMVPTKIPNHGGEQPPPYDSRVNPDGSTNPNVPAICKGTALMTIVDGMTNCVQ